MTITCISLDICQDVGNRTKRSQSIQTVSTKHFINKRDIHNIRVKVQDRLVIRHQDDAQSVFLAVSELQQEPYNPIAFKVQGKLDPIHSTLPEDAFLLAIQTKFQRDMYQKYAGCILCINSTHGTNAYRSYHLHFTRALWSR